MFGSIPGKISHLAILFALFSKFIPITEARDRSCNLEDQSRLHGVFERRIKK